MKSIVNFINEQQDWWSGKDAQLIDEKTLLQFANKALKNTKLYASDLQDELSQYEDIDELDNAWENNELKYCKFEDELSNLLSNDTKYSGKEGDICDRVWIHAWDLLDDLIEL